MRRVIIILLTLSALFSFAQNNVLIRDIDDKDPIPGAYVISANGLILGATDNEGKIKVQKRDFPISVRCLGYDPLTVDSYADSINLKAASYILPEAVISTKERPITRVLTYAREYATGEVAGDTVQLFSECMIEYYFADGKVKGYHGHDKSPSIVASRIYCRLANENDRDTVFMPEFDDNATAISLIDWKLDLPYDLQTETEALRNGATLDSIPGKYYTKYLYTKTKDRYIVDYDDLADNKNHKDSPLMFKLIGFTLDIDRLNFTSLYKVNSIGKYGINDLVCNTINTHMLTKSKWMKKAYRVKKPIEMNSYIEQYPVEIQRITIDDYKKLRHGFNVQFQIPEIAPELPSAIQNLINQASK